LAVYWLLFAYFAAGAILAPDSHDARRGFRPFYLLGALLLIALIGLRYEVGADWLSYTFMFAHAGHVDFWHAISIGDPGYQAINWIASQVGGIWIVNTICAAIFVWGLCRFCDTQPNPWLAVLVAIPYMVIAVAMGYTRQGVALGILMAGLAAFLRGASTLRFAAYVFAAGLFHSTAVVAFPLVALASERNRFVNLILALAVGFLLYNLFLGDAMDEFVKHYVKTGYSSQGAAIRVAINVVATVVFWISRRRVDFGKRDYNVWRNFSLASLLFLVLLFVFPSSTAVDRMSIYVMPLQVAAFARVPLMFKGRFAAKAAIIGYVVLIQFVWLNYAQFSRHWIPYRLYPI
jgi:hypothetical protein